ncbi:hypothetical protein DSM104299_02619 [Baekduia alba]|uniref:LamG domain-containing protein n=1 Tax=Baekduia alba TaxID=2997333 RepID=UPI002341C208|nr:LamG domain-containing protein [Baekduia alba]WCB93896.1 hypothetical protein DSM104299_02619 [Baekduia alba]
MQGRQGTQAAVRTTAILLAALCALLLAAATASADNSTVIGQWRFDEGAGQTVFDDGPSGLDGRLGLTDAADDRDPARIAGLSGGALHFDGKTFVRLPDAPELQPSTLSVEAVVRAGASPGQYRYIVSRGAQGCEAASWGLYTGQAGGIAFYVYNGDTYRVSATAAPADIWNGGWHHVAGVFDGSALRLYVDGHPVGEPQPAPSTIAYSLTSPDTYFGTYQGTCALPLDGDVDAVRIWRGPLSPDFVGRLSDAALNPMTAMPPPTPDPSRVPTATAGDSQAGAPASRSVLAPIAAGQSLPSTGKPSTGRPAAPGAPTRACVIKPSIKRLRAGRKAALTVHVALRGKPLGAVKVVATDARSRKRLGSAKTARDGKAKLKVKPARRGTLTVTVLGRADCASAAVTVTK